MKIDWNQHHAAIWQSRQQRLRPITHIDPIQPQQLIGIERQKRLLLNNSRHFLQGLPANNALLWGARGTGKSSLIKAVFNALRPEGLRLIEVDRDDLHNLPEIVADVRELPQRFILYCDDLSFNDNERNYRHLKSVLEGSIELPPQNLLFYATSNRRHLLPEKMEENQSTRVEEGELHYADAIEEKISLSDRFGLWLSFYAPSQDQFLQVVDSLLPDHPGNRDTLHRAALQFAAMRGSRNGRTARQFFNQYRHANNA